MVVLHFHPICLNPTCSLTLCLPHQLPNPFLSLYQIRFFPTPAPIFVPHVSYLLLPSLCICSASSLLHLCSPLLVPLMILLPVCRCCHVHDCCFERMSNMGCNPKWKHYDFRIENGTVSCGRTMIIPLKSLQSACDLSAALASSLYLHQKSQ